MKLWKIEAVRGLAALYVAISHLFHESLFILRFGQEAVIVFFLISGFVIEYSHQQSRDKSFKSYFLKRFARIYSVFILMLILVGAIQHPSLADWNFLKTLGGNLLMLQDFDIGKPNVIVPTLFAAALWSLHYEWWFYMLYHPIVSKVRKDQQLLLIAATSIFSALFYTFYPHALPRLLMYFVIWWTGVDLARSYLSHGRVLAKDMLGTGIPVLVVTFILIGNVFVHHHNGGALRFGTHPILELRHFIAAIVTLVGALVWQKARWVGFSLLKPGIIIAPISYSLYISHQPLLAEASYLKVIGNSTIEYTLYLTILLVFCWFTELKAYPAIRAFLQRRTRPLKSTAADIQASP